MRPLSFFINLAVTSVWAGPNVFVCGRSFEDGIGLVWFYNKMALQGPVNVFASLGALDTAYLTYAKLSQVPLACPSSGSCTEVLNSSFGSIGPVPLSALGLLAYLSVVALNFGSQGSKQLTELLWWLCFSMALTSLGLTAILIFVLKAPCLYCAASAFITAMLVALVETKRAREERTERSDAAVVVAMTPEATATATATAVEAGDGGDVDFDVESPSEPRRAVLALSGVLALGSLRAGTLPSREFASAWAYFNLVEQYKPNHPPVRSSSSKVRVGTLGMRCVPQFSWNCVYWHLLTTS